jgi:hypothetical protein
MSATRPSWGRVAGNREVSRLTPAPSARAYFREEVRGGTGFPQVSEPQVSDG